MKKLKLNLQSIGSAEVLSREQLKTIMGGSGAGSGSDGCKTFVCKTADDCVKEKCGDSCSSDGRKNFCWYNPFD